MNYMSYNKIQDNFWIDEKVRSWNFKTRMISLYLLSNQHSYSEGYYRLPLSYIAEDMRLEKKEIIKSIEILCSDNFIKYDRDNSIILIVNALKYQPLQNINHCKAALNKLKQLPSSPLLKDFVRQAEKYNPKFYKFLKKESKKLRFLKEVFVEIENKGLNSTGKDGISQDKTKSIKSKSDDSPALTQALTLAQSPAQAQAKTNVSQKDEFNEIDQLCCYLIELIEENNPRASLPEKDPTDPLFKKWAKEIERLKRLGPVGAKAKENKGYSLQEIRDIISFSQKDQFWKSNILSAKKLRKQVIKLENKMKITKLNDSKQKTNMLKNLYLAAKEEEDDEEK